MWVISSLEKSRYCATFSRHFEGSPGKGMSKFAPFPGNKKGDLWKVAFKDNVNLGFAADSRTSCGCLKRVQEQRFF